MPKLAVTLMPPTGCVDGVLALNSHWSPADACCVQSVYCRHCHQLGTTTWLGVQVNAVLANCCPRLQPNQACTHRLCLTLGKLFTLTWLGVQVNAVLANCCPRLQPNQACTHRLCLSHPGQVVYTDLARRASQRRAGQLLSSPTAQPGLYTPRLSVSPWASCLH